MIKIIKTIRDAEREALDIIDEAKIQSALIKRETEEKLGEVSRMTYEESIAEAEHRTSELLKDARKNAEFEVDGILKTAQPQIEELQEKARKNFSKTVVYVLNELIL